MATFSTRYRHRANFQFRPVSAWPAPRRRPVVCAAVRRANFFSPIPHGALPRLRRSRKIDWRQDPGLQAGARVVYRAATAGHFIGPLVELLPAKALDRSSRCRMTCGRAFRSDPSRPNREGYTVQYGKRAIACLTHREQLAASGALQALRYRRCLPLSFRLKFKRRYFGVRLFAPPPDARIARSNALLSE